MKQMEIKDVCFSYQHGKETLSQLNIDVTAGERVGIIGANGAGKSTFLKLLVGLITGYEGDVRIHDMALVKENLSAIRQLVGYVFQDSDSQLFLSTVYEDVAFGPLNHGFDKKETDRRVMEALKKVHMEDFQDRQVYRLSGGEKKLASIATILAMEPEILLLDEPSVALDPKNRRNLIRIINEMDVTMLLASHDLDMILDTCDRTILLDKGRIIRDGKTEEILRDEELLEAHGLELPLSLMKR